MLTGLRIEQFTVIAALELDFSAGMTAFTGETGAGKSIMIDALSLILGGRADPSVVRPGATKCDLSAAFYVDPASPPAQWLQAHDLFLEEGEIFLRRVIYAEGRSKSTINGHVFPLQKIKELSELLVHIHGQHQNQTLMLPATHREQLDRYAKHGALLAELAVVYQNCQKLQVKIQAHERKTQDHARLELLAFQIEELDALALEDGELEALHEEHQLLHHAKDHLHTCGQIDAGLAGDEEGNVCQHLYQLLQLAGHLPKNSLSVQNIQELLNNALIQCEEAKNELQLFSGQVQLDPERLALVEARMSRIHQVARKYHVEPSQLLEHLDSLKAEQEALQGGEELVTVWRAEYAAEKGKYEGIAQVLSASRKKHAKQLALAVTASIQKLGMPKGLVELEVLPLDRMQEHGLDHIEYKVCTNPGMHLDLLSKVASGGELARIGLAIQILTAEKGATPTLLFDEVDVGIGGSTAALVGQMLRSLGERLQVFCVTHQAQVAACAHQHLQVEKNSENEQTFTCVHVLQEMDRVKELARMLGGLSITQQTLSHAEELLHLSHA